MKKMKITIMILAIITIILIGVLIKLSSNINNTEIKNKSESDKNTIIALDNDEMQKDITRTNVNSVKNSINAYLMNINKNNTAYYGANENGEYVKIIPDIEIKTMIYQMLSENYITKNNITIENLYQYVEDIDENVIFNLLELEYHQGESSDQYVVSGFIQNTDNEFIKNAYYIVNINESKKVFSIEPILEENINIKNIAPKDTKIDSNTNNTIPTSVTNIESICRDYLNQFKRLMLSNPEIAYNYINKEYREKRFDGITRI